MNFCSRCALPVNLDNEYTRQMVLENERELKISITSIREEMNLQFSQIMSMIEQNPKLAQIKPDILANEKIRKFDSKADLS
jgi:hypothetical protein